MEHHLVGSLLVANLTRHGSEGLLLVQWLQSNKVLLNDHLHVDFLKFDVCTQVDDLEDVSAGQVDGRLVLAVVASALPVGAETAVVPVLVAPGGWHGQDPLGLHDVVHAFDFLDVVLGFLLLGAAAGVAQGLLDCAVPLLFLCFAGCAQLPGDVGVLDFET